MAKTHEKMFTECPKCGSENIDLSDDWEYDETGAYRDIECSECGMFWTWNFAFIYNSDIVGDPLDKNGNKAEL